LSETDRLALADVSQKQSKSAKIEEWKSLPLNTDEDRHDWWARRYEVISLSIQSSPNDLSKDTTAPQEAWVDTSPMSVNYDKVQPQTVLPPSVPSIGHTSAFITSLQSPLEMMLSGTPSSFNNCLHVATHTSPTEGTDENDVHQPLMTSTEPSVSTNSQVLSADRWRKYF
jgi:hypothetical protein